MSTEARAPGEDVEGLRTVWSKNGYWFVCHPIDGDDCVGPFLTEDAAERAAATLRDLSRKLAKAHDATDQWHARAENLEAALEEARRERDEWRDQVEAVAVCRQHTEEIVGLGCVVCRVEVLEEALRDVKREMVTARTKTPLGNTEARDAIGRAWDAARRALSLQPQEPATEGKEGT